MAIIRTDHWLRQYVDQKNYSLSAQRKLICNPLISYFKDASVFEVHEHLLSHGLFPPLPTLNEIDQLEKNNVWGFLQKEFSILRSEWKGPDVPLFIFPSNMQNRSLKEEFNGKTGLSYKDKIFLFISAKNSYDELKALLTHEYNHTCRLNILKVDDLNFLQTIILEGLAENAVEERIGKKYLAPWTSVYTREQAIKLWYKYLRNNANMKASSPKFQHLLFGTKFYPKYLGYNVGYHITKSYCEKFNPSSAKTLLTTSAESILKGSDFNS
ncbi:DUF2268 domain-containing protein [Bacillus sp. Marseille-P3661]|uniref:DUF2268 domain-containing protein n=1 Tax=Bacillus sp. Marseille-P3661 TaxID=1936234 RepID=UPI000C83208A|nr:DUF2268 domain-containing putative Zn-dependent protease [Bacillus sp. Marseille-P3661]